MQQEIGEEEARGVHPPQGMVHEIGGTKQGPQSPSESIQKGSRLGRGRIMDDVWPIVETEVTAQTYAPNGPNHGKKEKG